MNNRHFLAKYIAGLFLLLSTSVHAGEFSANIGASNNYIWRGLTQTENQAAISGGIDFTSTSGFYVGTWTSNVSFAPGDVFSYEHDVYFGYSGTLGDVSYDLGYLYYNYDDEAAFDFGEVYAQLGVGDFSIQLNVLANTEADEGLGQDFGFGQALYVSADYATEISEGLELGIHLGYHDGDFNEAFNGVPGNYTDFNVSLAKDGFSFMISGTDLDDAGADGLDNDSVKFVVGYSLDFEL